MLWTPNYSVSISVSDVRDVFSWATQCREEAPASRTTVRLIVVEIADVHWENYILISFQIEWDMVVVTVFLLTLSQMEFHLVQNRKENCHHDHIPFNVKGNGNIVFSVLEVGYKKKNKIDENRIRCYVDAKTLIASKCVYSNVY